MPAVQVPLARGPLFAAALVAGWLVLAGPLLAKAPDAGPLVRLSARLLECPEGGGAIIRLAIRNLGDERIYIKNDFHIALERIRGNAHTPMLITFVWPARGFRALPPGESRAFTLPLGTAEPGQDDGLDLRGKALVLETEFWFHGYGDEPVRRSLTLPGCPLS